MANIRLEKIKSINTAKKLFDNHYQIRVVPCKINPNNIWNFYFDISKDATNIDFDNYNQDKIKYNNDFDFLINHLGYYNLNNENGKYFHFYKILN